MPKGPQGQKCPADAIGAAVMVGKIATGEVENTRDGYPEDGKEMATMRKLRRPFLERDSSK